MSPHDNGSVVEQFWSAIKSGDLDAYGAEVAHGAHVIELQGGKIVRETDYFSQPFEAPEWRARWVERM